MSRTVSIRKSQIIGSWYVGPHYITGNEGPNVEIMGDTERTTLFNYSTKYVYRKKLGIYYLRNKLNKREIVDYDSAYVVEDR